MRKYNIGDWVMVRSIGWYNSNKNFAGEVRIGPTFISSMVVYCGRRVRIRKEIGDWYLIEGCREYTWCDEFFEDIKNVRREKLEKLGMSSLI